MEKCKFCQAELAENETVCPSCGKDNALSAEDTIQVVPAEETVIAEEAAPVEEATPAQETAPAEEAAAPEAKPSAEIKEGMKATPGKIALMIGAIVVVAALIVALLVNGLGGTAAPADTEPAAEETVETAEATEEVVVGTIPPDGNPDDVTCKGSYTVSDEEVIAAADTVVATMGDYQLTNGQLQVYYWLDVQGFLTNYGTYAASLGLDYTQPLDTQISVMDGTGTWQQYFLKNALNSWHDYQALSIEAEANGFRLPQEDLDYLAALPQTLEEQATQMGFADVKEMLAYNVGSGAALEDYLSFMELYYLGYGYFNELYASLQPTQEELEAYFAEHQAEYEEMGLTQDLRYVDARHILITPQGGTTDESGVTTYSDEEWAACEAEAQAILDQWLAGEATEESFAALANEKSADGGSNTNGGLYEGIYEGQMVEPFENWCFDESRVYGDSGLVKTTYGYHIMYFVGSEPVWTSYAESDILTERSNSLVEEIGSKYPMEVDYSAIALGFLDMST